MASDDETLVCHRLKSKFRDPRLIRSQRQRRLQISRVKNIGNVLEQSRLADYHILPKCSILEFISQQTIIVVSAEKKHRNEVLEPCETTWVDSLGVNSQKILRQFMS